MTPSSLPPEMVVLNAISKAMADPEYTTPIRAARQVVGQLETENPEAWSQWLHSQGVQIISREIVSLQRRTMKRKAGESPTTNVRQPTRGGEPGTETSSAQFQFQPVRRDSREEARKRDVREKAFQTSIRRHLKPGQVPTDVFTAEELQERHDQYVDRLF